MYNPVLDSLFDNPFDRLRALLDGIRPPPDKTPIALSIGEPKHAPPTLITQAIIEDHSLWGRYPPVDGTPEFRSAACDWLTRRFDLGEGVIDCNRHLLPCAGTREALFLSAQLVVPRTTPQDPPPLVLMPNPFYQSYVGAAVMAGGEAMFLPTARSTGFLPDLMSLDAATLDRTALFYLCTPANPQGSVADMAYLKQAVTLARKHDFVLAVDECYSEIYDDVPPPGALAACASLSGGFENVLVFHSLSKRSSAPGLRSGFIAGDENLIAKFRRLRGYGGATVPLPLMAASVRLWRDEEHVTRSRDLYRKKFDLAEKIFSEGKVRNGSARFGFVRPAGGFFLWLDVGNGEAATKKLWAEEAIRVLPGAYLSQTTADGNPGERYIRVALVHNLETTSDALMRLARTLE